MKVVQTVSVVGIALSTLSWGASGQHRVQDVPARQAVEQPSWMRPPEFSIEPSKQGLFGNKLKGVGTNGATTILSTKGAQATVKGMENPKQFMADKTQASDPSHGPAPYGMQAIGFARVSENTTVDPYANAQQPKTWGGVAPSVMNPMYSTDALSTDPGMSIGGQLASDSAVPELLEIKTRSLLHKKEIPEFMAPPETSALMGNEATATTGKVSAMQVPPHTPAYPVNGGAPVYPASYSYVHAPAQLIANPAPKEATQPAVKGPAPKEAKQTTEATELLETRNNDGCLKPVRLFDDCHFKTPMKLVNIEDGTTLKRLKDTPKGAIVPAGCRVKFFSKDSSSFRSNQVSQALVVNGKGKKICFQSHSFTPVAMEVAHNVNHAQMAHEISELKRIVREFEHPPPARLTTLRGAK